MTSVAVIDDHWLARSALSQLLEQVCPEMPTIEASSGQDLFEKIDDDEDLRLVFLDLYVPGEDAWSTLRSLRSRSVNTRIVILSMSEDRRNVLKALHEGAVGYIPKSSKPENILSSVRRVLAGEVALPQNLLIANEDTSQCLYIDDNEVSTITVAVDAMTPRQREVFELMADSPNNSDIASTLGLSVNTVRVHLQAIAARFGGASREKIIHLANRWAKRTAS